MKALDYLLIICAMALLGVAYFISKEGNAELSALVSMCAFSCSGAFGARIGGSIHKKNQENK